MPSTIQPGLGLRNGWNLGESNFKDEMDANLFMLSVAVQPALEVISGTLPASPTDGLLAWNDDTGKLQYSDGGAWTDSPVQPKAGWSVWAKDLQAQVTFDGTAFTDAPMGNAPSDGRTYSQKDGEWVAQDYLINTFLAEIAGADSVQAAFIIPGAMSMPKDMAGSVARCNTASAADLVLSIRKNNNQVGTITFLDGETDGAFDMTAAVTFAQNDELSIVAPSPLGAVPEGIKILFRLAM